ncbi:MAG: CDP-archaeol synthase [Gammaproteobacteria bacterium]|nr:CDP-archaeol synthase [Gammaproteobacteria bacterium]
MLKTRLITAAILVSAVAGSVLWLSQVNFAIFFAAFAVAGGWEWSRFLRLHNHLARMLYAAVVFAAILLCWFYAAGNTGRVLPVLIAGMIWWMCALILVFMYPKYASIRGNRVLGALIGLLVIVPCWLAIVELRNSSGQGVYLVLFLLGLVAVADSSAYFGGKKWGANKLAPHVSPGKTWEGVIGGMLGAALFSFVCSWFFEFQNEAWQTKAAFIMIGVVTAITSVLGDLTESMFKRQVGLKDSGSMLPGHGGVLDRIDSLTAAAPVFAVCTWMLLQ